MRRSLRLAALAGLLAGIGLSVAASVMWAGVVRRQERDAFTSSASDVSADLGTLLGRNTDFVASLRGVLTMEPNLTPSRFLSWYSALDGSRRQVGSIGTGVISNVPPSQVRAFLARRDEDPIFKRLLGRRLTASPGIGSPRACLLSAEDNLVRLNSAIVQQVQMNWCDPANPIARVELPMLMKAASSRQIGVQTLPIDGMTMTFFDVAFYRRGRRLATVAEREANVAGWIAASFDMPAMVRQAVGSNHGLSVTLLHVNPGQSPQVVASVGSGIAHPRFVRTVRLSTFGGLWTARISGDPVVVGLGADEQALLVLLTGFALTVLIVSLALVLTRARDRALRLVEQRTAELRHQAMHDALTGLPNRRSLVEDLLAARAGVDRARPVALVLFDLDGFKDYNDTFGHPAGDALLARLGDRLALVIGDAGRAYRMGGDEFCVVAEIDAAGAPGLAARAAASLSESGEAFAIGCSYGLALLPDEARSPTEALRLADTRMYEHKSSRMSAGHQSGAVLVKALTERSPEMGEHLNEAAALAGMTAQRLGCAEPEVKRIVLAAQLHDVGTVAIPDCILTRPGPLSEEEWQFIRRHTIIGERIMNAAPSLGHAAVLVRSSHERFDGTGYPDGLHGSQIPLGAAVIAVCEAFDAMTSQRPYSDAIPVEAALLELRRCAGTQFDPKVVAAFCEMIEEPAAARWGGSAAVA